MSERAPSGFLDGVLDRTLANLRSAWREIALADGEAPTQRGYPPSLGGVLAGLVEQAGAHRRGTVTAMYAVLVEGDDFMEPVTDSIRALLDGHVVLSRKAADAARYPAIDVLRSLSRTVGELTTADHRRHVALVRSALDTLEAAQDLFAIGAYQAGADAWLDGVIAERGHIENLIHDEKNMPGADPGQPVRRRDAQFHAGEKIAPQPNVPAATLRSIASALEEAARRAGVNA